MKEQTLIEMKNKLEASTRVLQQLINEITYLRELSVGTLETVKLLPGYQDAINELKRKVEENIEEKNKAKENGIIK
jgi:hypothetical protein